MSAPWRPARRGRRRKQPVARRARRLLQSAPRLLALPAYGAMGHAEPACKLLDRARLAGGGRPQAVVDRDRDELWPALERAAPARHQHQQRRRVGTAGDGEDESANAGERSKQRLRLGGGDRRRIVSSGHASVLARPPASPRPTRAEICAGLLRATRRPPPSRRARQATVRGAEAHRAPWRWIRIWSRR